ncbi:MAG: hypothetical protein ACKV0T_19130 [Planctomycetales bacterium]
MSKRSQVSFHPWQLRGWPVWLPGVLAALLLVPAAVSAQGAKGKKGAEAEKVLGKITELERKGKSVTLTIDKEEGGTLEVLVTPKMKCTVTGKGDASFFQSKAWVSSEKVVSANKELFGHQFTVHFDPPPAAQCRPDPKAAEVYLVSGRVVNATDEALTLDCGAAGGTRKINFEKTAPLEVTVQSNDTDLIVEGAVVEVEGTARGTKFQTSRLSVQLDKPLTLADVQAASGQDKKGAKTKTAAKGGKKTAKGKGDDPEGEPVTDANDPFGLLGKKDGDKGAQPKKADKP